MATKPLFDITNYINIDVCMHCYTEEEARVFLDFLHDSGRTWSSKDSYKGNTEFKRYKENTCYAFNKGKYGRLEIFKNMGFIVLEFEDFDWSKYGYKDNLDFTDQTELFGFLGEFVICT